MAEIVLSAALRDVRASMEVLASGGAGIAMSARFAADVIDALGLFVIAAEALEADAAHGPAGHAVEQALAMAEARTAELQALSRRMAARIARLTRREIPVEVIAAQASLPPGQRSILPFPVIARPRPITDEDVMAAMRAIAAATAPDAPIDALEGDRPPADPLRRDRAEDGA